MMKWIKFGGIALITFSLLGLLPVFAASLVPVEDIVVTDKPLEAVDPVVLEEAVAETISETEVDRPQGGSSSGSSGQRAKRQFMCKSDLNNDNQIDWRDIEPMQMVVKYNQFFLG